MSIVDPFLPLAMVAFDPLRTFASWFMSHAMKAVLLVVGILALLVGLLWIGQGTGFVHWPASSFMIDQRPWALRGAILSVAAVVVILFSRRR
jgi:hypothetical protein